MPEDRWVKAEVGMELCRVPIALPSRIKFGHDNNCFLRFCANHAKPFGFRWEFSEQPTCPKCGDAFSSDDTRSFVLIKIGYTVTQEFHNGKQVFAGRTSDMDVLSAGFIG